jgi:hypothetical protein
MWEPRRLTTLRGSTACYRDSFTFSFYLVRKVIWVKVEVSHVTGVARSLCLCIRWRSRDVILKKLINVAVLKCTVGLLATYLSGVDTRHTPTIPRCDFKCLQQGLCLITLKLQILQTDACSSYYVPGCVNLKIFSRNLTATYLRQTAAWLSPENSEIFPKNSVLQVCDTAMNGYDVWLHSRLHRTQI